MATQRQPDGSMQVSRMPLPPMPAELKQVIEEQKSNEPGDVQNLAQRARRRRGAFKDYTTEVSEGMVVLDAVHKIQAEQAPDLAVPLELQGRQVRLVLGGDQRQAAADVHDAG